MSVGVLFSAVGPVLFSQSLAWTGSYRLAAYVCLAAASILLLAAMRAKQPMPARTAAMPVTPALEPVVAIEAIADERARLREEYAQV